MCNRCQLKLVNNTSKIIKCSDGVKLVGMQKSRVDGSLKQNIDIKREVMCCKNQTKKAELQAVFDIGEELKESILIETSKAAKIYS